MKKKMCSLISVTAIFLCMSLFSASAMALCLEQGQKAPDFSLEDVNGKMTTLSQYKGKVVFLAFWASWCPRCMEELAFLQGIYFGLSDELVILAINQETQNLSQSHVEKLRADASELGIRFPVLLDKNLEVWKSYCINALPTSMILDREGRIRFQEPNYYWASQEKIKQVLSGLGVELP